VVLRGVGAVATRLPGQMWGIRRDVLLAHQLEGVALQDFSPAASFRRVYGALVFHRSSSSCEDVCGDRCWASTGAPWITYYTDVAPGAITVQNVVHELGHAFAQRAGRQPYRDLDAAQITYVDPMTGDIVAVAGGGWGTGYVRTAEGYVLTNGRTLPWQQNTSATANEDFADMFLGWSYNRFAPDAAGVARYQWMATNMPRWIALAVAGRP
jgi:hypothetical protein